MTTTLGVHGNQVAVPDPYQNVPVPSEQGQGCTRHNYTAKTMVTLDPGVYCGGIGLNASAEPRHLFNRPRKPQRERQRDADRHRRDAGLHEQWQQLRVGNDQWRRDRQFDGARHRLDRRHRAVRRSQQTLIPLNQDTSILSVQGTA